LVALHDGRIKTAGDLAQNICHDAGSLTRLVDQMVERGFILRDRSETDRRVVTLVLTPRGRDTVEALAPKIMHFWNGLLSGFSHEEVDSLINLLTRLVIVADSKQGRKTRLLISNVPIAKPVAGTQIKRAAGKTRRAS
jgi:DNA-binding MarR family transcriptional regulator